jgi:hypothetical protein
MNSKSEPRTPSGPGGPTLPIDAIQEAVESIRFGVVQLIIQDGRVVQIDKTEKIRLT